MKFISADEFSFGVEYLIVGYLLPSEMFRCYLVQWRNGSAAGARPAGAAGMRMAVDLVIGRFGGPIATFLWVESRAAVRYKE